MLRFILFFLSVVSMMQAMASDILLVPEIEEDIRKHSRPVLSNSVLDILPIEEGVRFAEHATRSDNQSHENQTWQEVTVTAPGTLYDAIGEAINTVDSLVVKGPINDADFNTLWNGCFYGHLSVINLEEAKVENGKIPSRAFWHQVEQLMDNGTIIVTALRKLLLPDHIEEIGDLAFSYCIHLEHINIPAKLRKLGLYCFADCIELKTSPLRLPEGLTDIPGMCFLNCMSLREINLPSSIRYIGEGAFYMAKIKNINFPEGLQTIDNCAFYATDLEEVYLPSSCQSFPGTHHFAISHKLKKINIPEGVKIIPSCFVYNDLELTEINIPQSIECIKSDALSTCMELTAINLPEGLKEIDSNAFWYCSSVKELVFPSSLAYLGGASCQYMQSLEAIYCSAPIPPVCDEDPSNRGRNHTFGRISGEAGPLTTPNDIPVYVPVGTAPLYASAYGWNYFSDFIETSDFPASSVESVEFDRHKPEEILYDLAGNRVIHPIKGHIYICNGKKIIY